MNKKTVFVTGGTRGIGRAIVEALLAEGYHVITCARDITGLTDITGVEPLTLNIADRVEVDVFVKKWKNELYALVNNTGVFTVNGTTDERLDEPDKGLWDTIMDTNLHGLYWLTKGLYPHIEKNGRIVNIASQLGTTGRAGMGAYVASKHAVLGLTKSWALEVGGRGITVNAVSPGWVKTESNIEDIKKWATEEGKTFDQKYHELADPLPLRRFIEPAEVANVVTFLLSDKASGITGANYEIK